MAWLAAEGQADLRDLGLPQSRRQIWADVRSGAVACLAALLPILLLNYVLTLVFRPEQIHPLIDQLQQDGSPAMLLVGIVSAVLAAPLFEEFVFRVLLQGWLERVEDKRLDFLATERVTVPVEDYPDQAFIELIETADPTADEFNRRGRGRRVIIAIALVMAVRLAGLAAVNVAAQSIALTPLIYLNVLLPIVIGGVVLLRERRTSGGFFSLLVGAR